MDSHETPLPVGAPGHPRHLHGIDECDLDYPECSAYRDGFKMGRRTASVKDAIANVPGLKHWVQEELRISFERGLRRGLDEGFRAAQQIRAIQETVVRDVE